MIQKSTIVYVSDRCGIWYVKTFHVYKGFSNRFAGVGDFIRASVRRIKPKYEIKLGLKVQGIIIRTRFRSNKFDGSYILKRLNNVVLLKKRMTPKGKVLIGPIMYGIRRKKFRTSFAAII
jgi:ribosomal protein L14